MRGTSLKDEKALTELFKAFSASDLRIYVYKPIFVEEL